MTANQFSGSTSRDPLTITENSPELVALVHTDKLFVGSEGNSGNECKDLLNSMRYPQAPEPCEQPAVVSAAPLLRHHRRRHRQGGGQVGAVQYSTVQYSKVQ